MSPEDAPANSNKNRDGTKRSSKLRSDSGYFTYISTARPIISGELLK